MTGKIRLRLAVVAALAAMVAVFVPGGLASGSHDGDPAAIGDPSVVLLNLGAVDDVTWDGPDGKVTQSISTHKTKCTPVTFGSDPELLTVTPTGGDLGIVKEGLGVRSNGDGNSGPCGLAEASDGEAITVALGADLDGYLMTAVDLDLELKHGAVVEVTFNHDGSPIGPAVYFDPTESADDGPDSGDGDNYRFNSIDEGVVGYFDEVVLRANEGDFSLEAGFDGTANGAFAATGSSQFQIVLAYDGLLDCFPDTAQIGTSGLDTTYGTVTMRAMDLDSSTTTEGEWVIDGCNLKPYNSELAAAALSYVPDLPTSVARYTIDITVESQPLTTSGGMITSLIAEYDPTGDITFPASSTQPLEACNGQPILDGTHYDTFWTQDTLYVLNPATGLPVLVGGSPVEIVPAGETACFYHATAAPTLPGFGTEYWSLIFIDDPSIGFR